MGLFRTIFHLIIDHWQMLSTVLLSIALVSTSLMQSEQKKEIDSLNLKVKQLEEKILQQKQEK